MPGPIFLSYFRCRNRDRYRSSENAPLPTLIHTFKALLDDRSYDPSLSPKKRDIIIIGNVARHLMNDVTPEDQIRGLASVKKFYRYIESAFSKK